ncbi:uncharacterized protein LOC133285935 isoform X2 [Gastrolobium bilobum]|uniref:uncharacterized protein LOC133285935 isoform X2 n=1 Tax=Gastrolobium bilobum TaxID=150636 RepID=UPI002AB052D7|nr:uncharacterized protein LOC133285935 isoform X2 [Gastrolobium bilobum]
MMVSGNDPVESFYNSISVVKEAFLPLEVGIRRAAKDLEHFCGETRNKGNEVPLIAQVNEGGEFQICGVKKKGGKGVVADERKKRLPTNVNWKFFLGMFSPNSVNGNRGQVLGGGLKEKEVVDKEDGSCPNFLQFAVNWSLLVNEFFQSLPGPFKSGRKRFDDDKLCSCMKPTVSCEVKRSGSKGQFDKTTGEKGVREKEGKQVSLECLICFNFVQLSQTIQILDPGVQENDSDCEQKFSFPYCHWNALTNILQGHKVNVNGFLRNLGFAKVDGIPSSAIGPSPSKNEEGDGSATTESMANNGESSQKQGIASEVHPDKKKLYSVQDFFRYTEAEGRRFFEELDRDSDGQVTMEDLEIAMRKRKLPQRYAHEFMRRTRSHLFSKSFGWNQFLSLMEQKEPTILRAYTSLCLSKSGTLKKSEILESLKNARLPANEGNAVAMMRFLNADAEGSISYGHFRNFMILLPSDRLREDPRNIWFEAATVVAVPPSVEIPAGSVLRSALAGGLSCALSCALMHPVDTIKTQVQASTLSFPEIISKLPQIGARGLYKGSIPAILGQFSSHGLRTGIFEASKLVLINVAPTLPEIQVQSILSFCSTILGTAMRIPCEVLKQRLQAGLYDNLGEALVGTWRQDGLGGFFRGTGATLCREVPFYVAGTGLYEQSKKAVQQLLGRELEAWETVAVGALSGGLAAVTTTPFDVMKTRMMTAQGRSVSMTLVGFSILRHEGPLGLFKGAVPRFFWIAPLGAMNFAGYELARKALNKNAELTSDLLSQKKEASSE